MGLAPLYLRIAYMIARHLGYRSQSIVRVEWSNYQPDAALREMLPHVTQKKIASGTRFPRRRVAGFLASLKVRAKDGKSRSLQRPAVGEPDQLQKQSIIFWPS